MTKEKADQMNASCRGFVWGQGLFSHLSAYYLAGPSAEVGDGVSGEEVGVF